MNPDLMFVLLLFVTSPGGAISTMSAEFSQKEACEAAGTQFASIAPRDVRVRYTCAPKFIGLSWDHQG